MSENEITPPAPETTETPAAPEPTLEELAKTLIKQDEAKPSADDSKDVPPSEVPPADTTSSVERVSPRIAAAKRAEMRAAQARLELRREREAIEATKAELAELKALAEQIKAAKASPSEALKLLEQDPKTFLESLATEHEPQAVVAREIAKERAAREKLEAELKAEREAREQTQRHWQSRQIEAQVQAAQKAFIDHVAEKAEAYPHLTDEYTPEEIAREALSVAEQHSAAYFQKFGVYPDDEVIAEYLESQAKARAEKRTAWRERIGQRAHPPSQGKPGELREGQSVKAASAPRTLTNGMASQKASAPKPWSQEAADEESLRLLKTAFR